MQSLAKQFKALRTEIKKQGDQIRGFVPNPSEVFEQYAKILSNVTEVDLPEMKLFLKEYLKDHFRKKIEIKEISQEKVEEVLYEAHHRVLTSAGVQSVLNARDSIHHSLNKDYRGGRKLFQSEQSAKISALVEVMEKFLGEISGISGYSKQELSQAQYAVLEAIVDGL